MRSISCALISFVLFYMAVNIKDKYGNTKGVLALLSFFAIAISLILMMLGA